jgi:predicted dehydrogenase
MTSDNQQFSVGIIGAGDIVSKCHLPVLLAMAEVSRVWIADADWQKAQSIARAFRVDAWQLPEDLRQLPEADVFLLAIPFGARQPYYEALRDRDSALYVEKPFSKNLQHHAQVCSWFADYRLACGLQRRSWGPTLLVKRTIEDGLFGQLRSVRYGHGTRGITTSGKYYSNVELAGGGLLFESGVHGIDAVLFCSAATGLRLVSAEMVKGGGFDIDTTAVFRLTTPRQAAVDFEVDVSCVRDTIEGMEFTFDDAVVSFAFGVEAVNVRPQGSSKIYTLADKKNGLYPSSVYELFFENWSLFLQGIRARQANWTSAAQTVLTTQAIERLYEAGA